MRLGKRSGNRNTTTGDSDPTSATPRERDAPGNAASPASAAPTGGPAADANAAVPAWKRAVHRAKGVLARPATTSKAAQPPRHGVATLPNELKLQIYNQLQGDHKAGTSADQRAFLQADPDVYRDLAAAPESTTQQLALYDLMVDAYTSIPRFRACAAQLTQMAPAIHHDKLPVWLPAVTADDVAQLLPSVRALTQAGVTTFAVDGLEATRALAKALPQLQLCRMITDKAVAAGGFAADVVESFPPEARARLQRLDAVVYHRFPHADAAATPLPSWRQYLHDLSAEQRATLDASLRDFAGLPIELGRFAHSCYVQQDVGEADSAGRTQGEFPLARIFTEACALAPQARSSFAAHLHPLESCLLYTLAPSVKVVHVAGDVGRLQPGPQGGAHLDEMHVLTANLWRLLPLDLSAWTQLRHLSLSVMFSNSAQRTHDRPADLESITWPAGLKQLDLLLQPSSSPASLAKLPLPDKLSNLNVTDHAASPRLRGDIMAHLRRLARRYPEVTVTFNGLALDHGPGRSAGDVVKTNFSDVVARSLRSRS